MAVETDYFENLNKNKCKKCNSRHDGDGEMCGICQDNEIERLNEIIYAYEVTRYPKVWNDIDALNKRIEELENNDDSS